MPSRWPSRILPASARPCLGVQSIHMRSTLLTTILREKLQDAQLLTPSPNKVAALAAIYPLAFSAGPSEATRPYLSTPAAQKLVSFFIAKGIATLKEEDRHE